MYVFAHLFSDISIKSTKLHFQSISKLAGSKLTRYININSKSEAPGNFGSPKGVEKK